MNSLIITAHAVLSAACWGIVGIGATWAVYSHTVRDTTLERIGLGLVAIMCFGTVYRVIRQGWVSEGGLLLSASIAFYVLSIIYKHWHGKQSVLPADKTRPGDLRKANGSAQ